MTIEKIMEIVGIIYVAISAMALVTPSDKDNTIIEKIGKICDRIGFKIKGR